MTCGKSGAKDVQEMLSTGWGSRLQTSVEDSRERERTKNIFYRIGKLERKLGTYNGDRRLLINKTSTQN